ncbi:MAG: dehydrogenase [Phycisphaeraceae bacterium]|nr:dehydrogenase [Phycisphaeraceae bacterium]
MIRELVSLDRRFTCPVDYVEPDRYRALYAIGDHERIIAQGAGTSYTAASFGRGVKVVSMRHFDRILDFDAAAGLVEVEASCPLGRIDHFLARHGYTLPVQPGHPQITVGGCIACNAHGKNPYRDGLFCDAVQQIRLFHPRCGLVTLHREAHRSVFELTCGGFGLTGVIVSARLQARPQPRAVANMRTISVGDLHETFEALDEQAAETDVLYTWNDLSRPSRGGRGFVVCGQFEPCDDAVEADESWRPLESGGRRGPRVWRRGTVPVLNELYRRVACRHARPVRTRRFDAIYPITRKAFYYRLYGRYGFVEQQVIMPNDVRHDYADALSRLVRETDPCVVLASCKAFRGPRSLLHFRGVCLSVDVVPDAAGRRFLDRLDDLNDERGAISNLCKDSRLSAEHVRKQYGPEYERFRRRLHRFDPGRQFVSALSERIDL